MINTPAVGGAGEKVGYMKKNRRIGSATFVGSHPFKSGAMCSSALWLITSGVQPFGGKSSGATFVAKSRNGWNGLAAILAAPISALAGL
jgi:hypothetical protein